VRRECARLGLNELEHRPLHGIWSSVIMDHHPRGVQRSMLARVLHAGQDDQQGDEHSHHGTQPVLQALTHA
jgi:hypothetical protein